MTIVWVILAVVIALILLWLWAIAPHLPRADFSAFAKYDYAHRGLHDKEKGVPENSLLAFDMACRGGFGMELDGRIVIHHDRNIRRTCGVDRNIDEMTYEELSGYRLLGSQERVPLFSDVLKVVDGRTPLIVEFKSYTRQEELCRKAMALLEGYQGLYCVESFDPRIVRWFKKHHPQTIRGQLMCRKPREGMSGAVDFFNRLMVTNAFTRPHFEAYDFHLRHHPSLRLARRVFGMQEVSWTLRSLEEYQQAKEEGCLCIFEKFLPPESSTHQKFAFSDLLAQSGKAAVCLRSSEREGSAAVK